MTAGDWMILVGVLIVWDAVREFRNRKRRGNVTKWMYWNELAALRAERDQFKAMWERDSTALGKALAQRDTARTDAEDKRARVAELEGKVTAIVGWLEREQPDVFRRGLWDALREVQSAGTGL